MATLPTPLRAALGLAATAIDEARKLPETLPQLPVAVIGTAMQASLRVQQHIAEYAARGDELISQLRGGSDEPPSWATFDDDAGPANGAAGNGATGKAAFELIEEDDAVVEAGAPSTSPSAGPATPAPAASAETTSAPAARTKAPPAARPTKAVPAARPTKAQKASQASTTEPGAGPVKKSPAKKAAKKAIHSEPLAQAAERAEPTDRPNPSVLAAEIAQAHPGETRPGAAQ